MIRTLLTVALLLVAAPSFATEGGDGVIYSEQFAHYYPQLETNAWQPSSETPLENAVVVRSRLDLHVATFLRTDGTKVPHDRSAGFITIELRTGKKLYISLREFRHVELSWVNERLFYISSHIGHVATVDAVLDVEDAEWLYRKSHQYVK